MVIKISPKFKDIMWSVVFIFFANYYGLSQQVLFLIVLAFIGIIAMRYGKLILPKIYGCKLYIVSIIIMCLYGISGISYARDYIKGGYYVLPVLAMVVFGYYLRSLNYKNKSILLTLELCGLVACVSMYISAIINMADLSTIEGVRAAFGKSIYEISMILVMLISECVLRRKTVFNRKIDTLSMVIMGITVVISLGRAQIIAVIAAIFIMAICNYLLADKKSRAIKSMIGFTTICIFLFVITMYALPQSVSDKFYDKIENSTSEISSTQEFDSFSDIATNWRGYEMSCAKEQWKNYNIFEMMFGGGIQKKTYLKNIPEYYIKTTDFYINQETPLLHNGYYTLLIKGGILAVVGAVIWLISPVYMLYKKKKNNENIDNVIILLGLSVMMILYTYVVRGIVGQTIFVVFGIAVGWLNSDINSKLWKE